MNILPEEINLLEFAALASITPSAGLYLGPGRGPEVNRSGNFEKNINLIHSMLFLDYDHFLPEHNI